MTRDRPLALVVLTPIPTPYRDPFWSVVAEKDGVSLTVLYCASGKGDRPWDGTWKRSYPHRVLPGQNLISWRGADASCYWNPSVLRVLRGLAPDVLLIGGYNHVTMWLAMRWAARRGIPFFLMCETYWRPVPGLWKRFLKRHMVGWIMQTMAGAFPTGQWAREYLLRYGAASGKLTLLPNVPDVPFLQAHALASTRVETRREHGIAAERKVILFAGRLIPKKRADVLIQAFARANLQDEALLVLVGDGRLRPQLQDLCCTLGLGKAVLFAGFVQPSDMPDWYAMADLFVLPSAETWGVVVLEAAASGLPVLVSDRVGCGPDVLEAYRKGASIPFGDVAAWAEALRKWVGSCCPCANVRGSFDLTVFRHDVLATRLVSAVQAGLSRATS